MELPVVLGFIVLSGLLGVVGQGMRVVVGIKKNWEEAAKDERVKSLNEWEKELYNKIKVLRKKDTEKTISEEERKELERLMGEMERVVNQKQALAWFKWNELVISLIIAFPVGAIAGILAGITLFKMEINGGFILSIISAGYAGTDFIEGFMKARMPK